LYEKKKKSNRENIEPPLQHHAIAFNCTECLPFEDPYSNKVETRPERDAVGGNIGSLESGGEWSG
jgi:hypothetical protein